MRLEDIPREALALVAALALAVSLHGVLRTSLRRARLRRRFERGHDGEREAARLLEEHGFAIEGVQVSGGYDLAVDGRPVAIALRADYVVTAGRARYVAEVKTGATAPRIETAATRRQLLEYEHAFAVDGVLLVDADAGRIHRVDFARRAPPRRRLAWAIAFAILVLAALWSRA